MPASLEITAFAFGSQGDFQVLTCLDEGKADKVLNFYTSVTEITAGSVCS